MKGIEDLNLSDTNIINRTRNCVTYFTVTPVLIENTIIGEFEKELLYNYDPIAYNIMVHKQPLIFELFLAVYFRPYDYYVIHLDAKVCYMHITSSNIYS